MAQSITKSDSQKLINGLNEKLKRIKEIANEDHFYASSKALGYAEGVIEQTIKQLNGDYSIR